MKKTFLYCKALIVKCLHLRDCYVSALAKDCFKELSELGLLMVDNEKVSGYPLRDLLREIT
jgi:hypothetical protein